MISENIMNLLHDAIQVFDKRCGQQYLIIFGAKGKYQFVKIQIKQSHFWHLLGCKLEPDTNSSKGNTYSACINKIDVSEKISSIHGYSEIQEKYIAVQKVFDFIDKARQIKIGYTVDCPEQYIFQVGTGNEQGVIGYDYPNTGFKEYLLPKSAQLKPLSKIANTTFRIFLIISKHTGENQNIKIEYEIKKGLYEEIKEDLPENIKEELNQFIY